MSDDAQLAEANAAMDRYASGDDPAFGKVYDVIAPRLYRFILRKTQDAAHAEDIVQQTFLQMHLARETYVTGGDALPWSFAIARRLAIDAFRKRQREVVGVDAEHEQALAAELCPEGSLRAKQAALRIRETLAGLPEAQRTAFELLKYDGLSLAQAAEVLGDTVMAVKLRAHRAYQAVRSCLLT